MQITANTWKHLGNSFVCRYQQQRRRPGQGPHVRPDGLDDGRGARGGPQEAAGLRAAALCLRKKTPAPFPSATPSPITRSRTLILSWILIPRPTKTFMTIKKQSCPFHSLIEQRSHHRHHSCCITNLLMQGVQ